jgi:microsomal dipeptidase-like Zn-dependent dipeptidase
MKLDSVTTIAIGRINADGQNLPRRTWFQACDQLTAIADRYGTIVAKAYGEGLTSDQGPTTYDEDTYVVVLINVADLDALRRHVAMFLRDIGGSSACFATDAEHEPVFPTANGLRPVAVAPPVTSAAYAPVHGGYPSV